MALDADFNGMLERFRELHGSILEGASKNLLRERIAASLPRSPLTYLIDMPRGFAAGLLALHPLATVFRGALELLGDAGFDQTQRGVVSYGMTSLSLDHAMSMRILMEVGLLVSAVGWMRLSHDVDA